jgi:hypothetical protein
MVSATRELAKQSNHYEEFLFIVLDRFVPRDDGTEGEFFLLAEIERENKMMKKF